MSQTSEILNHLQTHGSITSLEAINLYGATRLASIIYVLRQRGYNITTIICEGKTRYDRTCNFAKYVLVKEND